MTAATRTAALLAAAVATIATLSACSSAVSKGAAPVPAAPSTTASSTAAVTSPASSPTSAAQSTAPCVPITSLNAPTADAQALARVQQVDNKEALSTWGAENIVALVDQAAHDRDFALLDRLSGCGQRSPMGTPLDWHQPAVLDQLLKVIEHTHGAVTDGITFPAFSFAPTTPQIDAADMAALGVAGANATEGHANYHGLITVFNQPSGAGSCQCTTWDGAHSVG